MIYRVTATSWASGDVLMSRDLVDLGDALATSKELFRRLHRSHLPRDHAPAHADWDDWDDRNRSIPVRISISADTSPPHDAATADRCSRAGHLGRPPPQL